MLQKLGICSCCGGNVMGFHGAWGSVLPPPSPSCQSCGAIAKAYSDSVIQTTPVIREQRPHVTAAGGTKLLNE